MQSDGWGGGGSKQGISWEMHQWQMMKFECCLNELINLWRLILTTVKPVLRTQ